VWLIKDFGVVVADRVRGLVFADRVRSAAALRRLKDVAALRHFIDAKRRPRIELQVGGVLDLRLRSLCELCVSALRAVALFLLFRLPKTAL
jgi:hypothetical protein